jgi:hypothetical protein
MEKNIISSKQADANKYSLDNSGAYASIISMHYGWKSSHHLTDEPKSLKTKYSSCFMVEWAIVDCSQCILKTVTRTSTVLLGFQKT